MSHLPAVYESSVFIQVLFYLPICHLGSESPPFLFLGFQILGENVVEGLVLTDKKTGEDFRLDVAGVFIAVGQIPQNECFADVVKLDANGFILAAEDCVTSAPGIFAAGDCRTKEVRQLTTAAADGAVAALAACKYIAE